MSPEHEREFTLFVHVSGDSLLRAACLLVADRHAAQDLLQLALIKAVRHWPNIRDQQPAAYVRRVLATTAIPDSVMIFAG